MTHRQIELVWVAGMTFASHEAIWSWFDRREDAERQSRHNVSEHRPVMHHFFGFEVTGKTEEDRRKEIRDFWTEQVQSATEPVIGIWAYDKLPVAPAPAGDIVTLLKQEFADYEIDQQGRIQSPGKFEGGSLATIFYWLEGMNGNAYFTVYDTDTFHESRQYDYFKVLPEDVDAIETASGLNFDWLRECVGQDVRYRVYTDDSGFVHGSVLTCAEVDAHMTDCETREVEG